MQRILRQIIFFQTFSTSTLVREFARSSQKQTNLFVSHFHHYTHESQVAPAKYEPKLAGSPDTSKLEVDSCCSPNDLPYPIASPTLAQLYNIFFCIPTGIVIFVIYYYLRCSVLSNKVFRDLSVVESRITFIYSTNNKYE